MDPIELWVFVPGKNEHATLHALPIPSELLPAPMSEEDRSSTREVGRDLAGRFFLNAKLFNEKEVRTGVRDVVVAFQGKHTVELTMEDRSTWRRSDIQWGGGQMDNLEVVNLPSREWVTLSLVQDLYLEDARKLTQCDNAWLRGYFPDGTRFNERIPFGK
jgi:hypothetical protein